MHIVSLSLFLITYLFFSPHHILWLSDSIFLSQNFQGIQLLHLGEKKHSSVCSNTTRRRLMTSTRTFSHTALSVRTKSSALLLFRHLCSLLVFSQCSL